MTLRREVIIIVGKKFKTQLRNANILSIDSYLDLYEVNSHYFENKVFYLGQGISEAQEKFLSKLIPLKNISSITKATNQITHKKYKRNILITEPVQLTQQEYSCYLKIDELCDEMKDHLTGQHLSAMLLLEAARQLNTAVAEKFLLNSSQNIFQGFVVNEIHTSFKHYIYPFGVKLFYRLQTIKKFTPDNFTAQGIIEFCQNQKTCVNIFINYTVLPKKYLYKKERVEIKKLINNMSGEKDAFIPL